MIRSRVGLRVALAAAPLVLLAAAEGVLALLGVAPPESFFEETGDGATRHVAPRPLTRLGAVRELFDAQFESPKPEGTVRLFCVGASTVRGFPFDPHASFPGWLKLRLEALFPSRSIEVHTCAVNGRNAYALVPLVEELARYQPDAILVYSGQNELHDWNLPLLESPFARRLRALLEHSHLGRLLLPQQRWGPGTGSAHAPDAPGDPPPAEAAELPLSHAVWSHPQLSARVVDEAVALYESSLERMAEACRARAVPLLLARPVSNLADYPPATSVVPPAVLPHLSEILRRLREGLPAEWSAAPLDAVPVEVIPEPVAREALSALGEVVSQAPECAIAWFLRGRCADALVLPLEADEFYREARDRDAHPIRATEPFLGVALGLAREDGVWQVDPLPTFTAAAGGRVPGAESFVDNCHPNLAGQRLLADAFLQALRSSGVPAAAEAWHPELEPDEAVYEERYGMAGKAPLLARKFASLGLQSLEGQAARRGLKTRPSVRTAFELALQIDASCAEAQLGGALLELVAGKDVSGRIRTIVKERTDLAIRLAGIARAHPDWAQLLAPALRR